jgi:hypothetical protein
MRKGSSFLVGGGIAYLEGFATALCGFDLNEDA